MLTASQAQALGVKKHYLAEFTVASATKGTPDAPWFSDLTGGTAIEDRLRGRLAVEDGCGLAHWTRIIRIWNVFKNSNGEIRKVLRQQLAGQIF